MNKKAEIVDIDGQVRDNPDFPVAVVADGESSTCKVVYPILNHSVHNNLYGRIMTLVEATCETHKLKAVKDLFSKELGEWGDEVQRSAREIAEGGNSTSNIYNR